MAVHTLPRDPQDKTSSVLPVFSVSVSKVNTQTQIASVLSQTQQTPDHGCLQTPVLDTATAGGGQGQVLVGCHENRASRAVVGIVLGRHFPTPECTLPKQCLHSGAVGPHAGWLGCCTARTGHRREPRHYLPPHFERAAPLAQSWKWLSESCLPWEDH